MTFEPLPSAATGVSAWAASSPGTSEALGLHALGFVLFLAAVALSVTRCGGREVSIARAFSVALVIGLVRETAAGVHAVLEHLGAGIATEPAWNVAVTADRSMLLAYIVNLGIASVLFWGCRPSVPLGTGVVATVGAMIAPWLIELVALFTGQAMVGCAHILLATTAAGMVVVGWRRCAAGSRTLSLAWVAVAAHQLLLAADVLSSADVWFVEPAWAVTAFLLHIPFVVLALHRRDHQLLVQTADRLMEQVAVAAGALTSFIEVVDVELKAHQERHAMLARRIAERLGLSAQGQEDVYWAALLHDIGKLTLDQSIFTVSRRLTPEEWTVVRSHPEKGAMILQNIPGLEAAAKIVLHHHEQWRGGGYPDGIAGGRIPIGARIVALVDAFDAMISSRSYRRQRTVNDAVREIRSSSGTQFDPVVVSAFVDELERLSANGRIQG